MLNVAQAFDFGNIMNPSRWFDNDRYDRGYYGGYGPYGWGGPYGGYGPYGYGGPYGWGGYPGYGGWGYPGYGYGSGPSTIVVNPSQSSGNEQPAPPPRLPE